MNTNLKLFFGAMTRQQWQDKKNEALAKAGYRDLWPPSVSEKVEKDLRSYHAMNAHRDFQVLGQDAFEALVRATLDVLHKDTLDAWLDPKVYLERPEEKLRIIPPGNLIQYLKAYQEQPRYQSQIQRDKLMASMNDALKALQNWGLVSGPDSALTRKGVLWAAKLFPDKFFEKDTATPHQTSGVLLKTEKTPMPQPVTLSTTLAPADLDNMGRKLGEQSRTLEERQKGEESQITAAWEEYNTENKNLGALEQQLTDHTKNPIHSWASGKPVGDYTVQQELAVIQAHLETKKLNNRIGNQRKLVDTLHQQWQVTKTAIEKSRLQIQETLLEIETALSLLDVTRVNQRTLAMVGALAEKDSLDVTLAAAVEAVNQASRSIELAIAQEKPAEFAQAMDRVHTVLRKYAMEQLRDDILGRQENIRREDLKEEPEQKETEVRQEKTASQIRFSGKTAFAWPKSDEAAYPHRHPVGWGNVISKVYYSTNDEKIHGGDVLVAMAKAVLARIEASQKPSPDIIRRLNKKISDCETALQKYERKGQSSLGIINWYRGERKAEFRSSLRTADAELKQVTRPQELKNLSVLMISTAVGRDEIRQHLNLAYPWESYYPENNQISSAIDLALAAMCEWEGAQKNHNGINPVYTLHSSAMPTVKMAAPDLVPWVVASVIPASATPDSLQKKSKEIKPVPQASGDQTSGTNPETEIKAQLERLHQRRSGHEKDLAEAIDQRKHQRQRQQDLRTSLDLHSRQLTNAVHTSQNSPNPEQEQKILQLQWEHQRLTIRLANQDKLVQAYEKLVQVATLSVKDAYADIHQAEQALEDQLNRLRIAKIQEKTLSAASSLRQVSNPQENTNENLEQLLREARLEHHTQDHLTGSAHLEISRPAG